MKLGCFVFVHFIFNSLLNKTREKRKTKKEIQLVKFWWQSLQ